MLGREVWLIRQARKRGRAAARLHGRIIALFLLIAATPSIVLAVMASVTLDRGLTHLLSDRMRGMIKNSLDIGDVYVSERIEIMRALALAMAADVGSAKRMFDQDREQFRERLSVVATNRAVALAEIIDGDRNVIEKVGTKIVPQDGDIK